jgi:hypothetical protein
MGSIICAAPHELTGDLNGYAQNTGAASVTTSHPFTGSLYAVLLDRTAGDATARTQLGTDVTLSDEFIYHCSFAFNAAPSGNSQMLTIGFTSDVRQPADCAQAAARRCPAAPRTRRPS